MKSNFVQRKRGRWKRKDGWGRDRRRRWRGDRRWTLGGVSVGIARGGDRSRPLPIVDAALSIRFVVIGAARAAGPGRRNVCM